MSNLTLLLVGALLAIGGGWISDEIRAWRERTRELKSIKTALCDELSEVEASIKNMTEVWKEANVLSQKYLNELISNTAIFDNLRTRLFLISDDELRKRVLAFYRKFKDLLKKSEGKIGTLAEDPEAKKKVGGVKFDYLKSKDIHPEAFGKFDRQTRRSITPAGFAQAFFKANP